VRAVSAATSAGRVNAVGSPGWSVLIRRGCGGFRLRCVGEKLGDAAIVPRFPVTSTPAMNSSVARCGSSSETWRAGDFMKYEAGPSSVPLRPRSRPSLQQRTASMTMPALSAKS